MHIASKKKVYISGPITKDPNFKEHFDKVAEMLTLRGFVVMNPAILPAGFDYEDYMVVCFAMIDVSEIMCFLEGWDMSPGAEREADYAQQHEKEYEVMYENRNTVELSYVGEPTLGYVF